MICKSAAAHKSINEFENTYAEKLLEDAKSNISFLLRMIAHYNSDFFVNSILQIVKSLILDTAFSQETRICTSSWYIELYFDLIRDTQNDTTISALKKLTECLQKEAREIMKLAFSQIDVFVYSQYDGYKELESQLA